MGCRDYAYYVGNEGRIHCTKLNTFCYIFQGQSNSLLEPEMGLPPNTVTENTLLFPSMFAAKTQALLNKINSGKSLASNTLKWS